MTDLGDQSASSQRRASSRSGLRFRDIKGITKRNLLRIVRTPQLLFMTIVQPTIILLLFRYVLGGAIHVPGVDYVDYVVPGIFLEAVLIGGMTTALALATDLQAGMIDRFRSLPMARSAFLAGRTLADLCRAVLALAFIIVPRAARGLPVPQQPRRLPWPASRSSSASATPSLGSTRPSGWP